MWDLIVSVPDHCLSFYLARRSSNNLCIFDQRIFTPAPALTSHSPICKIIFSDGSRFIALSFSLSWCVWTPLKVFTLTRLPRRSVLMPFKVSDPTCLGSGWDFCDVSVLANFAKLLVASYLKMQSRLDFQTWCCLEVTLLFVCGCGLSPLAFWDNLQRFSALVDDLLILNAQRTRLTLRFFGCLVRRSLNSIQFSLCLCY